MADKLEVQPPIDTTNQYAMQTGENLPNHTTSLTGRGKFVKVGLALPVTFRTRQQAFRFCAWALALAEVLPDEDGAHTFEEVQEAIQNS